MSPFTDRAAFRLSSFIILAVAALGLSTPRTVVAGSAPAITTQPRNQTNLSSANAIFKVVASGQTPLFYQWSFNGTNLVDSAHIGGATTATLVVSNVTDGEAGNYLVHVSNSHGSAASSNATLTVVIPASITSPPASQSVLVGSNATFTASATGTAPLSYLWHFNGAPLVDGGRVSGSATTNLNLSNIQTNDAGSHQLVVTNNYGSATSAVAVLTVLVPPFIAKQPSNQVGILASSAIFTVAAGGTTPLGYQWNFNGSPLADGGQISGAATTNLTISNLQFTNSGSYVLIMTNPVGSVTSAVAVLTVGVPPAIVQQPVNQVAQWGAAASFSVVATGTEPLSYQWTFNGTNLAGATNSVFLLSNLQPSQAGNYAVTITNDFGSFVSSNATLTVNLAAPGVPFIAGFSPLMAYPGATVTITGTNFSSVAGSNTVYFGAVQAAVLSASVTNLVVTVPLGATFSPITETVGGLTAYANAPFLPTFFSSGIFTNTSLGPQIVLPAGSGPNKVVIADLDGDGKPDLIVANDYGNTISLYRNISTNGSLTTASFAPPVTLVTPPGSYSPYGLVVADVDGDGKPDIIVSDYNQSLVSVYRNTSTPSNFSSNSFATRVDFATGINPQGVEVRDLDGDGKPDLLVANSGDGTVSLFRNTGVVGSLTTNLFAPRVDIATGAGCDHVAVADLDGDGLPDIVTANNGAGTLSVLRNLGTPGSLTASSFAPAVNIPVLSEPVQLAIGDLDGDGKPDIIVTFYLPETTVSVLRNISTVGSLTTNSFAARVDFPLGGRGHTPALADLDGSGKPDLAVVTELSSLLSIFRNVSTPGSFTSSSLAPRIDFATGYNAWGAAMGDLDGDGRPDIVFANTYDNTISIYQNEVPFGGPPVISASPANSLVPLNGTVQLTGTVIGQSPLSYQWYFSGTNLTDNGRVTGSATGTLSISNALFSDAGSYYFVVTNSLGAATSSVAVVTVLVPQTITLQPTNQTVLQGSNVTFASAATGDAPLGYQWLFNGTPLADGGSISGSATVSLIVSNFQPANLGNYTVVVTNLVGSVTSAIATVTILNPLIATQPRSQSVLGGATVNFSVTATGQQPLAWQWQFNGTNLPGATNNPLVLSNVLVSQSGLYSVVVTNFYGMAVSSNVTLTVLPLLITTQPANQIAWPNGFATFKVNVSGQPPFGFDWQCNGVDVPGTWTNVLTLTNVQPQQFGTCHVIVSNAYGSVASSNATLSFSQVAVWGGNSGETNLTAGLTNIIAIAGGGYERMDCLALRSNGMAIHWPATNITAVTTNILAIAGGGGQGPPFLVLERNGTVAEWLVDDIIEPLSGLTNSVAIAPCIYAPFALRTNGTLVGGNSPGTAQGLGTLTNIINAVAISEGSGFSMALKADRTVTAWGSNNYGQTNVPAGLSNVIAIAAGYCHGLALKSDGTVTAWGLNSYGQTNVPPGLSNVVAIAAGIYHSLALLANGTVVAWGYNFYGQTNVPSGLTNVITIAAGAYHSMALIGNGPPVSSALLAGPNVGTNGFSLSLPSQSGRVYVLQYENSLSDTSWNSLPPVPGNGGTLLLTDPSPANQQRFYRVQRW